MICSFPCFYDAKLVLYLRTVLDTDHCDIKDILSQKRILFTATYQIYIHRKRRNDQPKGITYVKSIIFYQRNRLTDWSKLPWSGTNLLIG